MHLHRRLGDITTKSIGYSKIFVSGNMDGDSCLREAASSKNFLQRIAKNAAAENTLRGKNVMSNSDLRLEEWKLCQAVISQLEGAIYRRQGWFFALITALVVALLKDNPLLTRSHFTVLSLGFVGVFYMAEIIQRVPHYRAICRSHAIETCLRGEGDYDGPILSKTLGEGQSWRDFFAFFYRIRIWAPYVAIIAVILIVRWCAP